MRTRPRSWFEASVSVPANEAQAAADALLDLGSPGVVMGIEGFGQAKSPADETISGFFPTDRSAGVRRALKKLSDQWACENRRIEIVWRTLDEELWETNWQRYFKPVRAGRRFVVIPPWRKARGTRIPVIIKPGMAFGTGQHETTSACLAALDRLILRRRPRRALDLGTGTGILAIAMVRLGVKEVVAVDTDPEALAAARENLRLNNVTGSVRLFLRPLPKVQARIGHFPLVTANLYAAALTALETNLHRVMKPRGILISSGVLVAQEETLMQAFARPRWHRLSRSRRGEWVTRIFERAAA